MLISEFARVAGLTPDTVRFYVRLGLLTPDKSTKGGRAPYSIFTSHHVKAVEDIRLGQMLGLSLNQMLVLKKEQEDKGLSPSRGREIGMMLLVDLERKADHLNEMVSWFKSLMTWEDNGQAGPRPEMPVVRKNSDNMHRIK
jgi:DNA-binding transcriptional MerR regulator